MALHARAGIILALLALGPLLARADEIGDIQAVGRDIQEKLKKLPPPTSAMSDEAKRVCGAADEAVSVLLQAPADKLAAAAAVAKEKREACDTPKVGQSRDDGTRARLQLLLEAAVARLTGCLPKHKQGEPSVNEGEERDRCEFASPALKVVLSQLDPKPGDPPPDAVMLLAATKAQDQVDKLRVKAKDAYDRGDRATAIAIELPEYSSLGAGADRAAVEKNVREWARLGRENPRKLKQAVGAAQRVADRLVSAALELRMCDPQERACADRPLVIGLVANAIFVQYVKRANDMDEQLSAADLGLSEVKKRPRIGNEELKDAVAFRKLLESNPDVNSFFGAEAVGFRVSTIASTVSLRYVHDSDGNVLGRRNRFSLIFSAPTNKDGVARFVDSADALNNLAQVKAVWQLTNAPFKLPGIGTLNDFALGITAAQDVRSYFVEDAANPIKPTEFKKSFVVPSVGIRWAFLANPTSDYKTLLLLSYDAQRRFKNGVEETRCPRDPSSTTAGLARCFTGSWGEPVRVFSRLLGFELRQHMPVFDIGLKVKQDLASDKVDVEIPLYLIRSTSNASTTAPFAAGISVSRSKGDAAPRWALFVSAPLSFSKPDR